MASIERGVPVVWCVAAAVNEGAAREGRTSLRVTVGNQVSIVPRSCFEQALGGGVDTAVLGADDTSQQGHRVFSSSIMYSGGYHGDRLKVQTCQVQTLGIVLGGLGSAQRLRNRE